MKRVIVAGGRHFSDYPLLKRKLDYFLKDIINDVEIVSGGAPGADSLGERYAKENSLPLKIFPADWERFGRSAGPIRNREMAEYADYCVCFWDGKSAGTKSMISLCVEYNINYRIVFI